MSYKSELEKTVLEGNVGRLKKLYNSIEYISDSIIFACKHNKVNILKHLLNSTHTIILPNVEDETQHNAFYYAMRSSNVQLVDMLITKWPNNYFTNNLNELDEILALAYDELILKNVLLSDEIRIFIENKLVNLRFFSDKQEQIVKTSHENINERIELIIDNIALLNAEYTDQKEIDQRFLFIAKCIAQNIFILKRQLKSTYNNLPWEEIEFCLISFISYHVKMQEINIFYQTALDKIKILNYLEIFAKKLKTEQNNIKQKDVYKLTELPNLNRQKVITNIINNSPEFENLYHDYQQIRDIHSLMKMNDCINLALSADPKERQGQLVIIRVVQIIGEHVKNTLESPKLSHTTNELILLFLPTNTRKIIIDLRNSFSHAYALSKRINIEAIKDVHFFIGIQSDIKKIGNIITDILYKNKIKTIEFLLKKIINSNDLNEIKQIAIVFENVKIEQMLATSVNRIEDDGKIEKLVKELDDLITEKTNYEKELFSKITDAIQFEKNKYGNIKDKYFFGFASLKSLSDSICKERTDHNTIKVIKFSATTTLKNIIPNFELTDHKNISEFVMRLFSSVQSRMELNKHRFCELFRLVSEIFFTVRFEGDSIKWIEDLREKINEKQLYIPGQEQEKTIRERNYKNQLTMKLSELKSILNNNQKCIDNLALYRENTKLQAVVEMFVLDIMSILGLNKNSLHDDSLFLDDNSPLLIGKSLRNHLVHNNALAELLLYDPSILILLNAKKMTADGIIKNKKIIGKPLSNEPFKLNFKCKQSLVTIETQEKMFLALENGNLEEFEDCIKKGADINARNKDMWTALHFAAKGTNVEIVKFILDQNLNINVKDIHNQSPLHIAVYNGRKDIVKFFIEKLGLNVNEVISSNGKRPLHIAAQNGHKDTIEVLLRNKADITKKDRRGHSPLHYAVENNHKECFKILMKNELNVDSNETMGGYTSLHIATENGFLDFVNYLLENNANVNAKNDKGGVPLHSTALNGHLEVVKALISKGANVNARVIDGCSPLHYAVERGHAKVADILLKHGSNVNVIDKTYYNTPLHYAAKDGLKEIVENLLKYKADASVVTVEGITPLHFASQSGHLEIAIALLKHGVNIHARDNNNMTPLHYAAESGHKDVAEVLLKHGAEINVKSNGNYTPLFLGAVKDHVDIINLLIKNNAKINAQDMAGNTPLHVAATNGNIDIIEILIKNKAEIDAKNFVGLTPLHMATAKGNIDATVVLIKYQVNINSKANHGFTPLFSAILEGRKDCVDILIKSKAEINVKNTHITPLHLAVERGHNEIVQMLIKNGANVNIEAYNKTPLVIAVELNKTEIVKILIAQGADVNTGAPLSIAVFAGYRDIVRILLQNKARSNDKYEENATLLHLAAKSGHKGIVKDLLTNGVDVNAKTIINATALYLAAQEGHADVVELLLLNGANVNTINSEGAAIHIAAGRGYHNVIEILLNNGAVITLKDTKNRTPIELAVAHDHLDIVKTLLQYNEVDINAKCNDNWTILHIAAHSGYLETTNFLVGKGANINARNSSGSKPIHIAARDGHKNVVEYFITQGLSMNEIGAAHRTPLHYTAIEGQIKVAEYLIEQGANVNIKDDNGQTPVFIAARFGKKDFITFLLEHGAIYNAVDNFNNTPLKSTQNKIAINLLTLTKNLFEAVKHNELLEVKNCIKTGGIINAKNIESVTPLHFAAWKGYNGIVNILLQNKANPNTSCSKGFTPLHYAAKYSHLNVVTTLLSNGAVYNPVSVDGKIPFDLTSDKSIKSLFQLVNESFTKVKNNNSQVVNNLEKIKDTDTIKAVMNTRNRDNQTLIVTAMLSNFSKVKQLKEISQGDISNQIDRASVLADNGQYKEALHIYRTAFVKRKELLGSDNPATLDIKRNVATMLYKQGEYQEALSTLEDIKQKQEEILGFNNKDTLSTREIIALVLHRLDRNDEALNIIQEVYEKQKQILGPNDFDVLNTQFHMALVLNALEKYEEALTANRNVFIKRKAILGANHPVVISAQNNIAMVLGGQGKCEEALEIYKKVYEKKKAVLGANHPDTLRTLHNTAGILMQQNKDKEAMQVFQEVLSIKKKYVGTNHPETLGTQYNIANILLKQGKYNNALQVFNECYDQMKAVLGPRNPHVLDIEIKMKIIQEALKLRGTDAQEVLRHLQEGDNIDAKLGGSAASDNFRHLQRDNVDVSKLSEIFNLLQKDNNIASTGEASDLFRKLAGDDPNTRSSQILEIMRLLGKGGNIADMLGDGETSEVPHHLQIDINVAASDGDLETVERLLRGRTNPNNKDIEGRTPLHFAISNGHIAVVNSLIENGADITQVTNKGNTPLHTAVSKDCKEIVEILLQHISRNKLDEFINAKTTASGTTCLHIASKNGYLDIIKSLLQRGAIYNIKNKEGKTPLMLSRNQTVKNVLEIIDELFKDIQNDNIGFSTKLKTVKPDELVVVTNARNSQGRTLLQVATVNKNRHIATQILQAINIMPKMRDTKAEDDIKIAVCTGNVQTVERLLNELNDINFKDSDGRTLLHYAISNRHISVVKILLNNGANATQVTNKGNTPLHTAASKDYKEMVEILLKQVCPNKLHDFINAKTTASGTTSLHIAAKNGSFGVVKSLLQQGAIYNIQNNDGKTPLDLSIDHNICYVLKLIEQLFKDAQNGIIEVGNKLKTVNPDDFLAVINARNKQGFTLQQTVVDGKK